MTFRGVLERAVAIAPDATRDVSSEDGTTTWVVRGRTFAALSADGRTASFLLDATVAGAAARTPDARSSSRGPGWVDLSPVVVDPHAADRATAWFLSGYRRLIEPGV